MFILRRIFKYISDVPSSTFPMYLQVHLRCTFKYISNVPRPGWAAFVMLPLPPKGGGGGNWARLICLIVMKPGKINANMRFFSIFS